MAIINILCGYVVMANVKYYSSIEQVITCFVNQKNNRFEILEKKVLK